LGGNAASRSSITLDGVPQVDLFAGWVAFPLLDAAPLESATVTRGGGSVVAGPGAIAGTIALQSALPRSFVQLRGGSRGSLDGAGGVSLPVRAGGAFGLAGRVRRSDGFLIVDPALAGPVDVPARYRQWAVRGRGVVPVGAQTELQASLSVHDDQRLRGIEGSDTSASGADASLRLVHRGALPMEALLYAQLRDFTARAVAIGPGRATATLTLNQFKTPASGWGGRIELRPLPALRVGGDWQLASGETNEQFRFVAGQPTALRVAGGKSGTAGAFAEGSHPVTAALQLSAGIRIDRWSLGNGLLKETDLLSGAVFRREAAPDRSGWQATWRAGLAWQPAGAEALTFRAAGWSGWRLPTLNELHRPFRAGQDATAANPLLEPERSIGVDAGVTFAPLASVGLSLTVFHARLSDAVANVTLAEGPGSFPGVGFVGAGGAYRQRLNLPAIRSTGVEADATLSFGPWGLGAGLAWTRARMDGGTLAPDITGNRPAQTPAIWGTLGASYTKGRLAARLDLRGEGLRFEDDRNQRRLAGVATLDAGIQLRLGQGIALTFDAHNLSDRFVATGFSGMLPERAEPRTLLVGLRFGD
ncbi:MAG: TonB-dependent receptor, partial [Sphingomonadaceae bacterium]